MKKLLTLALAASTLVGCNNSSSQKTNEDSSTSKTLIICYSQTGATKAVADELQRQTGADLEFIECVNPYDGDFGQTITRWQQEQKDGVLPEINEVKADVADYDLVFLGYPIWGGTYAPPVAAYIKNHNLEGKTVVPFCTFGSGGLNTSYNDLKAALPKANIVEGYGVRNARISAVHDELQRFLIEHGYVDGEIAPLPDYSEMQSVTDAEKAVFDEACGNYQFPLGTPSEFGKRVTDSSTDYVFAVKALALDGKESVSTIYVTVPNGGKAEFTQVVR